MILRTTQSACSISLEGHGKGKTEPFEPALVVVDELHEGRTSTSDSDHTQLWNSVKSLNQYSSFAVDECNTRQLGRRRTRQNDGGLGRGGFGLC